MSFVQKFNTDQQNALRNIAKRHGFFFRNHGSQELTDEGIYRIYVDFDTRSVATVNTQMLGRRITENESFKEVDEIYFRGQKIWPLPKKVF